MVVDLTRPVATVLSDNAPTAKANHRTLFNDIIAAINRLDPLLTPSYASRAAAEAGAPALAPTVTDIMVREGTALVIRSRTASADDPLFSSGARWGAVLRMDMAALIALSRDTAILSLVSVGGTGNAITASLAPSIIAAGITALGTLSEVEYIPVATNTAINPTITIGGQTFSIRNADNGSWPAGGFVIGRSYKLRRFGTALRVISGDTTVGEMASARLDRILADVNMGTVTLESVAGTGDVITAVVPATLTGLGISAANLRRIRWQAAAVNTGPAMINIDGQGAVQIRDQNGAVLGANQFMPGRFYEAVKIGTVWRISAGDVTLADLTPRIATELAPIATRVGTVEGDLAALKGDVAGPFEVTKAVEFDVIATDRAGNPVLAWRGGPRGGWEAPMSDEHWQAGAEVLNLGDALGGIDPRYVTLSICLTQSLLFMDGDSDVAPLYPNVDPETALMIGGLRRSDGVLTGLQGPRSLRYDQSTPGLGFVSVDPPGNIPTGAYYAVKGYNGWRRKYGLIQRRNVGMLWGQPGEHITRFNAILGDAPSNLTDSTHHWDNLMYWMDEAARLAAAGDLIPRVDLLVTQGTSSKQDVDPLLHARTLRQLIVDLRRAFDDRGFEDAAIYFTQPGGDADTSNSQEHWFVTQSFLDLAEDGYGVLVAPEAPLRIFDNNVHFGEIAGQELLGMYNWARAAREAGRAFTIRKPIVTRDGLVVTLDYASLWDGEIWELAPDIYGGRGIDAFHGYSCDDATITGIELAGRKVRLTFDRVPLWIDYMMQSQNVILFNDGYTAFRGRLVTTTRMRDPLDPSIVHRRQMPSHGVAVPQ